MDTSQRKSQIHKLTALADRIRKCQEVLLGEDMSTDLHEVEEFIELLGSEGNHLLSKGEMEHFNQMWNAYKVMWDAYASIAAVAAKWDATGMFEAASAYGKHMMDLEEWINLPPEKPIK